MYRSRKQEAAFKRGRAKGQMQLAYNNFKDLLHNETLLIHKERLKILSSLFLITKVLENWDAGTRALSKANWDKSMQEAQTIGERGQEDYEDTEEAIKNLEMKLEGEE
tara:strand:+ start:3286 stop:3609 length:324 start_codon:yes stop_codon:yes gene_type:complete